MNHLGDTNKMVSDTPRTDEAQFGTGRVSVSFARQLERELNAANVEIEEKRKDIVYIATEKAKLEERIQRLEELGDWMRHHSNNDWWCEKWDETKEAKP